MMYTYKRNKRFPLVKRPQSLLSKYMDGVFLLKASLLIGIAVLLVLSFSFIGNAGRDVYSEAKVASAAEGGADEDLDIDIVFGDSLINPRLILAQEMPVIYGVDIEAVEKGRSDDEFYFSVLPEDIKLEILRFINEPRDFYVDAQGPQILIYHTHTQEAYRQIPRQEYVEAGKNYTKERDSSIRSVGEVLKSALEEYGYTVLHDETDHMTAGLKNAYSKSLATLQSYADRHPSLKVYIDVHRDSSTNEKDYVTIDGKECAKVMFVVGAYRRLDEKQKFESNYKLALAVTNELEKIKKGFTRPIRVQNSSKHYNQLVSDMCLLIEVGHNANTLEQAKNTAKYVAEAISRVIEISGP